MFECVLTTTLVDHRSSTITESQIVSYIEEGSLVTYARINIRHITLTHSLHLSVIKGVKWHQI